MLILHQTVSDVLMCKDLVVDVNQITGINDAF